MTRRTADWVLILVLMASWGVLFVRALEDGVRTQRGTIRMSVSAASSSETYPVVRFGRKQAPGLEGGDEVLSADGQSLRGASVIGFYDLAVRAARANGFVDLTVLRAGSTFDVRVPLRPRGGWSLPLLGSALGLLSGLFLLLRVPGWHLARRYFVAMWCIAIARAAVEPGDGELNGTSIELALNYLGWGLGAVLSIWNAQDFTLSARPVPRLQRCLAIAVGLSFAWESVTRFFLPVQTVAVPNRLLFGTFALAALGVIAGLTRAYRRSRPLERRQLRWVMVGLAVSWLSASLAAGFWVFANLTLGLAPWQFGVAQLLAAIPLLATPIGITISVVGYRWLDIDRLISATAAYAIAGMLALGAALAATPRLAASSASALDLDPGAARWLFDMAFVGAAGFVAHRQLRPRLDRQMFAERHRRMSGLELLRDELGSCSGADELWKLASERIDALLEPESLLVYVRDGKRFEPRFTRGAASAPSYEADSLLVRALERRARPLAADAAELDPFDRAALETLGVALVVPIRAAGSVIAFACLGPKRSGDIYTSEERAHLAALAARCGELVQPAAEREPPAPRVFRREGDVWTLASNGKEIRLRDMRGLHYLAMLLREPGREFAPLDMVRAASGAAGATRATHDPELAVVRRFGDAGPVLDAQARAEYRARVVELDAELADAERCADLGRMERASAEHEALLAELESSVRATRSASSGSDSERARVAVTKAIKSALDRIAEAHPELGAHLSSTVRRGYACAYEPDPREPSHWEV